MKNNHHNRLRFSLLFTYSLALLICMGLTSRSLAAGGITLDGTLGPSGTLSGPDVVIPHTVGTQAGSNLFHSFGTFNIGTGESATFTGPAGIANIIGRVTGGTPSSIDGLIRSTIDGANLFLLNPSGVMFGPNARLDVMGSFHVSTADYLKFANGDMFYANTTANSVLSVAEPAAFGFLSATPAGVSGNKAYLAVPDGKTLSIISGDISYTAVPLSIDPAAPDFMPSAPAVLTAPGGRINLVSVASPGVLNLSDLNTGSFAKLGNITFSDGAKISVMGATSAGSVVIRGGQMVFKDGGIEANGDPGGIVDIKGDSLHLDNYYILLLNLGETDHPGTACRIDLSNDLTMTHASFIDASTIPFDVAVSSVSGRAGDIRINARNINLGNVALDERSFNGFALGIYGYIASTTIGAGRGGDIYVTAAETLTLQNGFFINTQTFGEGNNGNITVQADTLQIKDKANISNIAMGSGKGGILDVTARTITVSAVNAGAVGQVSTITGIGAQTGYYSDGGTIRVTTDNLQLVDGGEINTVLNGPAPDFFATGRGADIQINAKNISISGYAVFGDVPYYLSSIDGRVYGSAATGTGGNISVTTDTLSLFNGGVIRTGLYEDSTGGPSGNAGSITLNAKTIDIASRGQIYADSFRGTGNSGDITINATTMTITGANNVPRPGPLDFDFTGLSTTTNAGTGGKITVALSGDLTVSNGGGIKADTQGIGISGAIDVTAANIGLNGSGTEINALSANTGNAGNIGIKTGMLTLADGSSVTTQTKGDGAGGAITVTADALALSGAGQITSSSSGAGNAGKIAVTLTGDLKATSGGGISVDTSSSGTGGSIAVDAKNITLADKGFLGASSSGSGHAGEIFIKSGRLQIESSGSIATRATDTGNAGRISVETGTLEMASAGQITSSSAKSGNAGNISVTATDSVYLRDSSITTEALLADGGNISIKAPGTIRLDNSTLTASVNGEKETTGGNIIIDPQYVILKGSDVIATAHKGTGGNIDITANVFLADASSVVSAASELGFPGSVNIMAPNNISGIISPLSADYTSASALLRERCIARIREGKYSSFVVGGRDGLPMEPGNMLPGLIH